MSSSQFKKEQYKKSEFKKFCALVSFKPASVLKISSQIENYYKEWEELKYDKVTGAPKAYMDGTVKKRMIRPSLGDLRLIQSRIKNKILTPIALPNQIHGGVKKRSNITNAKPHQGNKYIFTTDLQTFYPSIRANRVYSAFCDLNFSPFFSAWLTKFTTWKNELPQGTPTSTHVANVVFLKTDQRLIEFCQLHGLTYTRYVDDLTFSSQQDFKHLLNDILGIVTSDGFKLSYRKTKYQGSQTVTGIDVFLNKIDAPSKILDKAKLEIESESKNKPYNNYVNNIRSTNKKK